MALVVAVPLANAFSLGPATIEPPRGHEPPAFDCGTASDAGDTREEAWPLTGGCDASLQTADDQDWYSRAIQRDTFVRIAIRVDTGSRIAFCLFHPNGTQLDCAVRSPGENVDAPRFKIREAGLVHARVAVDTGGAPGAYYLSIILTGPYPDDDCGTGEDAPEDAAAAFPLVLSAFCSGAVRSGTGEDAIDWYVGDVPAGHRLVGDLVPRSSTLRLCLVRDGTGERVCESASPFARYPDVFAREISGGRWRMEVSGGFALYNLTLRVEPPPAQDDCAGGKDAGDHLGGAVAVGLPAACAGWFPGGVGDEYDTYIVEGTEGDALRLQASRAYDAPLHVCIVAPSDQEASCFDQEEFWNGISTELWASGAWGVRVVDDGVEVNYTWTASAASPSPVAQSDCAVAGDVGNGVTSARPLGRAGSCDGALDADSGDLADWYAIDAEAGEPITAVLTQGADLCVFAPGALVATECSTFPGEARDVVEVVASDAGTWRIRVFTGSGAPTYHLDAHHTPLQDDCGSGADAGDSFGTATPLDLGAPFTACAGGFPQYLGDTRDWYAIQLTDGDALRVIARAPLLAPVRVCLHDPAGSAAACAVSGAGPPPIIEHVADAGGVWRVSLEVLLGSGSYTLALARAPGSVGP